ncbi:MAG: ABC transporter substrate-binding protein [Zestosphaera sp.]
MKYRKALSKLSVLVISVVILSAVAATVLFFTTTQAPPTTTTTTTPTTTPTTEGVVLYVVTRHSGDIQEVARSEFLNSEIARRYNIKDVIFVPLEAGWWVPTIQQKNYDVGWGGGPTLFDTLYQAGLLAPLTSGEVLDAVNQIPDYIAGAPMKRLGPDNKIYWVAAAMSSFGFTVNLATLNSYGLPQPTKWSDLGSVDYARKLILLGKEAVGIADPTQSTSNTRMYEIILQAYGWTNGWKVLTTMAANAKVYQGSADVRDGVIAGDIDVGITIDFYGYIAQSQNPDCKYLIPTGETIVNGDPIALLKTSRNPEAAQAFIAWVLTEGQWKVWFKPDINRLPVNPRAFETPEGMKRQDLYQAFLEINRTVGIPFDDNLALSYEKAVIHYFEAVLVNLNSDLKQVWKTLVSKYLSGQLSQSQFDYYVSILSAPLTYIDPKTGQASTFTQEDAIRVTSIVGSEPQMLDLYKLAWTQAASQRYQQILSELGR